MTQGRSWVAVYITDLDILLYRRNGWDCRPLYWRGDDKLCFSAKFLCCHAR